MPCLDHCNIFLSTPHPLSAQQPEDPTREGTNVPLLSSTSSSDLTVKGRASPRPRHPLHPCRLTLPAASARPLLQPLLSLTSHLPPSAPSLHLQSLFTSSLMRPTQAVSLSTLQQPSQNSPTSCPLFSPSAFNMLCEACDDLHVTFVVCLSCLKCPAQGQTFLTCSPHSCTSVPAVGIPRVC